VTPELTRADEIPTPSVSIVIVAHETGPALLRCLESLQGEDVRDVVVVNNGSAGPEIEAAGLFDRVTVLSPGANVGFAAGCNFGARRVEGDVLVFLNPDTVVAPGAIHQLALALSPSEVGIAMPRLRLLAEPELLNSGGNIVHVTGIAWAGGYRLPADELTEVRDVPFATGAVLAVRSKTFRELGGFTEELFMYHEDLELSWRAHLAGLRVVVTPRADVYHDYEYGRHERKYYLLERNRLVFVLSAYSGRMLLTLAPLLLSAELGLVLASLRGGWFRSKLAAWAWCAGHAGWLAQHRRETQRLRRVKDRDLACFLTPVFDPQMIDVPSVLKAMNPLVTAYWRITRRAL
jgi:GT2 family glycosyltransferase